MFNKKILLLLLTLVLITSIGTISASNVTNDDTTTDTQNTTTITQNTIQNTPEATTTKTNTNKTITKNTNTPTKTATTENVNSYTQLKDKIEEIKTITTEDEYIINLEEGDYTITNPITWGNSASVKTLTINGNDITIDGQNSKSFIEVKEGYTLILNKLTVNKCNNAFGAVMFNNGTVQIKDSSFNNNQASFAGTIMNYGDMEIYNTQFTNNHVTDFGGAIMNRGELKIDNSQFINSSADRQGGTIQLESGNLIINNSLIDNSVSIEKGGAILASENAVYLKIYNTTFSNITTKERNGGIFLSNKYTIIDNSTFENNIVYTVGGAAIYNYDSRLNVTNSRFINNTFIPEIPDTMYSGGGAISVYAYQARPTLIKNCTFINNTATDGEKGGAIYRDTYIDEGIEYIVVKVQDSTFINTFPTDFVLNETDGIYSIIENDTARYIPENADATIYLDDEKLGDYTLTNGKIENINIPKGKHSLKLVVTTDDDLYKNNEYILDYTLYPINTQTNLTVINNTIGNTRINVTTADEDDEPISNAMISVIDEEGNMIGVGFINKNNESIISLDLPAGEHKITAIYPGNTTHASSNNTTTIKVLHKTNIKIDVLNETEGNVTAVISVTDENNQPIKEEDINITLPDGSKTTKKTDENGTILIKDSQLTSSETSVSANKTANDMYASAEASEIINIVPDYQKIIDDMNKTIQEQNQTIQDLNNTVQNQNQTIQDLNNTVQNQNQTIQDLNNTVQEQNKTIGNLENTVDKLNNTIKDLNDTVEEQKQTIDNLQDKISELNEKIDNQTKEINDKNKTIQDLNKEIKDLNDDIKALQEELDQLDKKFDELNKTSIIRAVPENGTVDDNKVVVTLDNRLGTHVDNAPITIKNSAGEIIGTGTTDNEGVAVIPVKTKAGTENITISYPGSSKYSNATKTVSITTSKNNVTVTVDPIEGIIGENIILRAHILDTNGNPVNGGNLVFKLNGKTLRTDGRFDSNASAQKFKVENGTVTVTITADLYLRNAKNLTASYSGTYKYNEAKSDTVTAQIKKRNAKITVTTSPKKQKQYNSVTFTAKVADITPNHKNSTAINQNTNVIFKINGQTIKDKKGNTLKVAVKNNMATYKYTVPAGMGGVTKDGKIRDYMVEAVLVSDTFYPDTRNTSAFNVERSPITIQINKVTSNSNNQLSVSAYIKDYKNNYVIGNNTIGLKINGKTYVNPKTNKTQTFKSTDGKLNLNKIQVSKDIKIKSVMVVSGARQAYLGGRNETTSIVKV